MRRLCDRRPTNDRRPTSHVANAQTGPWLTYGIIGPAGLADDSLTYKLEFRHPMKPCLFSGALALQVFALIGASVAAPVTTPASSAQSAVTLEEIMSDPDWIGAAVRDVYWSADGRAIYYSAKRSGSPIVDLHRVDIADRKDQVIEPKAMPDADGPSVFDDAGKLAAFVRNGDIFVRDIGSGRLRQITRTPQDEAAPQFSADGRLLRLPRG